MGPAHLGRTASTEAVPRDVGTASVDAVPPRISHAPPGRPQGVCKRRLVHSAIAQSAFHMHRPCTWTSSARSNTAVRHLRIRRAMPAHHGSWASTTRHYTPGLQETHTPRPRTSSPRVPGFALPTPGALPQCGPSHHPAPHPHGSQDSCGICTSHPLWSRVMAAEAFHTSPHLVPTAPRIHAAVQLPGYLSIHRLLSVPLVGRETCGCKGPSTQGMSFNQARMKRTCLCQVHYRELGLPSGWGVLQQQAWAQQVHVCTCTAAMWKAACRCMLLAWSLKGTNLWC